MTHKKAQKRKATDPPQNHVAFRNSTVKRVHYTTTDDAGSSMSTSIRGRIPITQLTANVAQQKDAESRCLPDPELDDTPEQSKRTQNGQLLNDFEGSSLYSFHWAEGWNSLTGFFVRHDISKLGHVIQLGHNGATNKIRQLMRSRLFPATTKDPHTAFTVNMLKEFQLHNLESKKAAYDYIGAIRRLSDNSFTADVARCGQLHGIDILIPHRPAGNLLVWCPACPEPGFNSDPNCPTTPVHLRQDSEYQQYLKSVPTSTAKATCNYLEVVNKQDKKKFKNMAITGTVNCQCSHVFILSCVDLPHAERFANSGYALAMALRNHKPSEEFTCKLQIEVDDVDEAATYDILACNASTWRSGSKIFPDQLASIKKMRFMHVLVWNGYMECIGHFHGETAEHYWPEANQLGPHVRQMNLGHRQDTMINHHGDWNHKKTMKIEKRNHYIGLSISFKDQVAEWQKTPRKTYKQGKEAVSVYKHKQDCQVLGPGLKIEDHQHGGKKLRAAPKVRDQIAAFRRDQKHLMAKVGDKVAAQTALGPAIEDEKLFLPSDLTESEREDGCCFSRHRGVQMAGRTGIRHLAGPPTHRENHKCPAQSQGSARLDFFEWFHHFPVLTEGDLFMKSVQQKRHVSDSKRTDGLLWRAAALATIGSYDRDVEMTEPEQADEDGDPALVAGTQMDRRKSGAKPKKIVEKSNKADMGRGDGWLWQLGKLTKMSNTEMEAWANEGDRVQWFRAEAEMQRWQEQWEQKLVELLRIRRSFGKMESVWVLLADMQPPEAHGSKAYARQKVAMYARRKSEAETKIKAVGYGQLLDETADVVALIEAERKTEAAVMNAALNGVAQ
ncbi:hypothetical protein B0H13DRAFT_1904487 [Mycena leptocephala]|nr:hypothetical protein B0H13DRAFT_1904487 [Mycena leptocephala]